MIIPIPKTSTKTVEMMIIFSFWSCIKLSISFIFDYEKLTEKIGPINYLEFYFFSKKITSPRRGNFFRYENLYTRDTLVAFGPLGLSVTSN